MPQQGVKGNYSLRVIPEPTNRRKNALFLQRGEGLTVLSQAWKGPLEINELSPFFYKDGARTKRAGVTKLFGGRSLTRKETS